MVDLAQLEIKVNSLELSLAEQRMRTTILASGQLEASVARLEKQFGKLHGAVQNFRILGSALAAGFVITRVANSALVKTLADYETALVTLKSVTTNANQSLIQQEAIYESLDEAARKTGQTTRFSAVEAAEGLLTLAKAGLEAEEAIAALPGVLALAQGQLLDVDSAAQIVTSAMRQFGIAAVDVTRITDVMAETANRTSTDVENLGTAFRFVGPIAAQLGRSIEETSGALGVLANAGIQGSLAGTTLRGVLTALISPTDIAKKAIAGLGLTVEELDPTTHTIEEIIRTLAGSFIGTAEAVDIFNKRNAATALILTQNVNALAALTEANESNRGSTFRLARAQDDTLAGALKKTSAAFKDFVLSSKGVAAGVREVVTFTGDLIKVLAGVDDPLLQANEQLNNFASGLKIAGSVLVLFFGLIALKKLYDFTTAIIAAGSAVGAFNIIVSANPLLVFGSVLTGATLALNFFNKEAESTAEAMAKLGSAQDDQAFDQLGKSLVELKGAIKEAADQSDFQEALDLSRSKLNLLTSTKKEIRAKLEFEGDNEGFIEFQRFKQIIEDSAPIELVPKILENAVLGQANDLAKQISERLNTAIALGGDQALTDGRINVLATSITSGIAGRLDISNEEKRSAFERLAASLIDIRERARKKAAETGESLDDALLGPEIKGRIQAAVAGIISALSGEQLKIPVDVAFGSNLEVFKSLIGEAGDEVAKFKLKTESQVKIVRSDEFIQGLAELKDSIDETGEAFEASLQKIRDHNEELTLTAGLDEDTAKSVIQHLESRRLLNAQFEQRIQLAQEEIAVTKELIQFARTDIAGARERGVSISELNKQLQKQQEALQKLEAEYQTSAAAAETLVEANKKLLDSAKADKEATEAAQDRKDALIQLIASTRDEVDALEQRTKTLEAVNTLDGEGLATRKAIIALEAVELDLATQTSEARQFQGLTADEAAEAYGNLLIQKVRLEEIEQKEQATSRQNARNLKQEADALNTLTENLQSEVAALAKSNVERELEIRLRRINTEALGDEGEELKKNVEVVLEALDQRKRAEVLGRGVARAFTEPLKDALKSRDFSDLARKLAENLFDIFFEVQIAQPLEDFFAKTFGKNKTAQQFANPGQKVVTDPALEDALAKIQKLSKDQKDAAAALDKAAVNWEVVLQKIQDLIAQFKAAFAATELPEKATTKLDLPRVKIPEPESTPPLSLGSQEAFSPRGPRVPGAFEQLASEQQRFQIGEVPPVRRQAFASTSLEKQLERLEPQKVELQAAITSAELEKQLERLEPQVELQAELAVPDTGKLLDQLRAELQAASRAQAPLPVRLRPVLDQALKVDEAGAKALTQAKKSPFLAGPGPGSVLTKFDERAQRAAQGTVQGLERGITTNFLRGLDANSQAIHDLREALVQQEKVVLEEKRQPALKGDFEGPTQPPRIATFGASTEELQAQIDDLTSEIELFNINPPASPAEEQELPDLDLPSKSAKNNLRNVFDDIVSAGSELAEALRLVATKVSGVVDDAVAFQGKQPAGQISSGNINLLNRPLVGNDDGSISSLSSLSFGRDNQEILVPTISPQGRRLSDDEAIDRFDQTGENLGIFSDVPSATRFAEDLSVFQGQQLQTLQEILSTLQGKSGAGAQAPIPDAAPIQVDPVEVKATEAQASEGGDQAAAAFANHFQSTAIAALTGAGGNIAQTLVFQIIGLLQDVISSSAKPKALGEVFAFSSGGAIQNLERAVVTSVLPFKLGGVPQDLERRLTTKIVPFAKGNPFSNSVVSKPTVAPLALFGEAGPEAIMPLKKTATGGLAVSAFDGRKEVAQLRLTRGSGGRLGVDLSESASNKRFKDGAFFGGTHSFQFGNVFQGQGTTVQNTKNEDNSQESSTFVFAPTYNVNGAPKDTFKKSAKQFEDEFQNRMRRR